MESSTQQGVAPVPRMLEKGPLEPLRQLHAGKPEEDWALQRSVLRILEESLCGRHDRTEEADDRLGAEHCHNGKMDPARSHLRGVPALRC